MNTIDLVNAALSGDQEAFKAAFSAAINDRVTDALEVKKVEIASTLLGSQEETNETETTEVETDGSESDGSAEITADETSSA